MMHRSVSASVTFVEFSLRFTLIACHSLASPHRSARLRSDDSHSGHIDVPANHVCDQVFFVSTPFACGNQRCGNRRCVDWCWPKTRQTRCSEAFI
jgi:hypothetical protein